MAQLKKEQTQIFILVGIVAVLGGVLGYQFVWRPIMPQSAAARPQMARLRTDLHNAKRQLSRLPELEQATAARRSVVEQLEGRLFKTVAVDTLLADLSSMASAAHVRIESLEPIDVKGAAEGSQGLYAEIPIQIRAKGGYHQLGEFIDALEQYERLIRLVHIEITGKADEPWRQSADMIVSTFRLLEPAQAAR